VLFRRYGRFISVLVSLLFLFTSGAAQNSGTQPASKLPTDQAAKLLPEKLGEFRVSSGVTSPESLTERSNQGVITSSAARTYVSKSGQRFSVVLTTTSSDSGAFAELTERRKGKTGIQGFVSDAGVGTASFSYSNGQINHLTFFKGRVTASLEDSGGDPQNLALLINLGRTLAETIDKSDGDIPVLVKHLPAWQAVSQTVHYTLGVDTLLREFGNKSVFDAVDFDGGAEAVIANYDQQRLVVIEFNTPQHASDINGRILARIQELRSQGQPLPTAYRRVGNYSVFVFDSPNEATANQLIDQVKYQQVVQWLGENPYTYREAVAEFTQTTLGVLVSVVKASGIVLVGSLLVGGIFGALLFSRRRAQQKLTDAYADPGSMLRLNLDNIDPNTDPSRLLGPGR